MLKNISYKALNIMMIIGIAITLLVLFVVPSIVSEIVYSFQTSRSLDSNIVTNITVSVYLCSIPYLIALFSIKRFCKILVTEKNPFSKEVPNIFKIISKCAFVEFIIFNITTFLITFKYIFDKNMFFSIVMLSVIISLIILAVDFYSLISLKFFTMAIDIKDENDNTI
ncbi:DUF2975 domain-containing protein [Metaclostridioides mangenotii]|uniref:DUF2975 domain-containing protein n=1 Tax=Metaclostridioides mangenotii TaxID=1540 RepID=UPI0005718F4B|nr:DUF2975 domain-containing protein [Clostridioides mangenotii]